MADPGPQEPRFGIEGSERLLRRPAAEAQPYSHAAMPNWAECDRPASIMNVNTLHDHAAPPRDHVSIAIESIPASRSAPWAPRGRCRSSLASLPISSTLLPMIPAGRRPPGARRSLLKAIWKAAGFLPGPWGRACSAHFRARQPARRCGARLTHRPGETLRARIWGHRHRARAASVGEASRWPVRGRARAFHITLSRPDAGCRRAPRR